IVPVNDIAQGVPVADIHIRPEEPRDAAAIRSVTTAAFRNMPHSQQTEAAIVDALRAAGAMTVSLVAVEGEDVLGHVAFSPVTIDGADATGWYGVGPLSVHPDRQKQGIGSALMKAGLQKIEEIGAAGCVLLGDPDYYGRFGFKVGGGLVYPDAPAEYFQALAFSGTVPAGTVAFHEGFNATDD